MRPSNVVHLDSYRGKRTERYRRALALSGHDPEKALLLLELWRALGFVGGDRGAVVWLDEYGPGLVHTHALLDLASDRPRRLFSPEPLKGAWESGVPGLLDLPDAQPVRRVDGASVRSVCAVALGSDGPRSWFLVLDSLTPRSPLNAEVAGELMFLAGELASLVLHRDLAAGFGSSAEAEAGTQDEAGGLEAPFAGWPVLQDIEGRRGDEEASRRIATRFLVARVLRGLADDDFVADRDSLNYQVNGVRQELDALPKEDPEREAWGRILASLELLDQDELLAAVLGWGEMVENMGHLHGALEIHALAYELAVAGGSLEGAVDAARFQGRVLRKLARWDEAVRWYDVAREVAEESEDLRKLALVLDGLGNTYRDRGNLLRAREVLRQVLDLGTRGGDRHARAVAHHDLMTVEKLAGDLDRAVLHGWEAAQVYDSDEGSLRALFDLAGVLRESGELSAARDAYSVVAGRVQGSEYHILALDALALIAALQGDDLKHDALRKRLDDEAWEDEASPVYRAQMYYFRGISSRALGREEHAVLWLRRALSYAEDHRLSKLIFDAEAALSEDRSIHAGAGDPGAGDPSLGSRLRNPSGADILNVRQGLRELRRTLVGSGEPL